MLINMANIKMCRVNNLKNMKDEDLEKLDLKVILTNRLSLANNVYTTIKKKRWPMYGTSYKSCVNESITSWIIFEVEIVSFEIVPNMQNKLM